MLKIDTELSEIEYRDKKMKRCATPKTLANYNLDQNEVVSQFET